MLYARSTTHGPQMSTSSAPDGPDDENKWLAARTGRAPVLDPRARGPPQPRPDRAAVRRTLRERAARARTPARERGLEGVREIHGARGTRLRQAARVLERESGHRRGSAARSRRPPPSKRRRPTAVAVQTRAARETQAMRTERTRARPQTGCSASTFLCFGVITYRSGRARHRDAVAAR